MNKRIKKKKIKQQNKMLIKQFPFLMPRNVWTNKELEKYDYSWTLLDDMPRGWKKAFGKLMCEDIMNELVSKNLVDEYRIFEIKEKYGTLRWYDNGGTEEIYKIIMKYEHISEFTCVECGKVNVPIINEGWIQPMCRSCYNRHSKRKAKFGLNTNYDNAIETKANLSPILKVTRFSKEENITEEYDCSDILKRMKVNIKAVV